MFEPPRAGRRRIRRETLSEDDLQSQLREKEVLAFDEVKLAMLEGGGRLSLIRSNDSSIRAYAVDLAADPLDLLAPQMHPDIRKDGVEHLGGKPLGLGIVAGTMVARKKRDALGDA